MLRSSLVAGRRAGARVAGGAASGSFAWGICSAAGLTALLAVSTQACWAVQSSGAAYLIVLGIRGWRERRSSAAAEHGPRPERSTGFRTALISNLLNPKARLFFLAGMPQIIPRHARTASYAIAFAAVGAVITGAWPAAMTSVCRFRSWRRSADRPQMEAS